MSEHYEKNTSILKCPIPVRSPAIAKFLELSINNDDCLSSSNVNEIEKTLGELSITRPKAKLVKPEAEFELDFFLKNSSTIGNIKLFEEQVKTWKVESVKQNNDKSNKEKVYKEESNEIFKLFVESNLHKKKRLF
ncbi:hypothetical protein HK099_007796 [Clydaea vesicula]|uniref:Uncharacterized protein n=1 Tax=Clydaea vesicula TaxID=447962 RepID=A0AAD5TWQ7_9FUNG|nr:hypothetical protein HK099_007796 [Clydaea vesicula]KAJ3378686.1 hypothetical protein HDU92_007237 [Lobulomyces angularis]